MTPITLPAWKGLDDPTGQGQQGKIGVLVAREGKERGTQHRPRDGRGEHTPGVRPIGQDQGADASRDVEQECEAGEPSVRRASHVYSAPERQRRGS